MKQKILILILAMVLAVGSSCNERQRDDAGDNTITSSQATQPERLPEAEVINENFQIPPEDIMLVQFKTPADGSLVTVIETTKGNIYLALYPQYAPVAVENYVALAQSGFYEGAEFSDVINNFYVAAGAPEGQQERSAITGFTKDFVPFRNETSLDLWHFRGALVMKNDGPNAPPSNTCRFFIVQATSMKQDLFDEMKRVGFPEKVIEAYREHGGIPGYDSRSTVFGQVYGGMEVVDEIAKASDIITETPQPPAKIVRIQVGRYDSKHPQRLRPLDILPEIPGKSQNPNQFLGFYL